jgi:hypothetical protein
VEGECREEKKEDRGSFVFLSSSSRLSYAFLHLGEAFSKGLYLGFRMHFREASARSIITGWLYDLLRLKRERYWVYVYSEKWVNAFMKLTRLTGYC